MGQGRLRRQPRTRTASGTFGGDKKTGNFTLSCYNSTVHPSSKESKEETPARMRTHGRAEQHARLLSELHQEFLAYGLVSMQDAGLLQFPSSGGFTQSAAGSFPPLKYLDREGREIVVRALAMFDHLIVNATVSLESSSVVETREGCGDRGGGQGSAMLSRRVTFEVPFWLEDESAERPQQDVMREARKKADRRRRRYERALDCLHVRLLPPLLGASLALTLVFVAAWIDGDLERWDYWRVLSPIWIACGVSALAAGTAVHAWRERTVATSSLRTTFSGLRGAVRYFMTVVVQDQAVGIASGVAILFLLALQLVMIGLRIEGMVDTSWFVVFVPLLVCFVILCVSPCLRWTSWGDGGAYVLGMVLGWTPAVLCILLLCSRLDGDNVSMSVVMAPLWAVDLVIVLAPVVNAVVVAVRRLRHGEPVDAMLVHTLAASWCLLTPVLAPVVAFEIALAVYVEGERDNLTAAEVFTPLIVWCCVLSLILCGYSCSFPPRHPEPLEGTYDHDSPFAQTPTGLATRLPRPRASASTAGGTLGGGGGGGVGGFGFGEGGLGGGGQLGGGLAGAGVGVGGIPGRSRWRPLRFPPSNMSPLPSSSVVVAGTAAAANHNQPPPRPLTPAPHANGMPPDMADVIALRSQLAELGMMVGFTEPFSASPSVGGGRPGGGGGGGPVLAIAERRVE